VNVLICMPLIARCSSGRPGGIAMVGLGNRAGRCRGIGCGDMAYLWVRQAAGGGSGDWAAMIGA
jgi:hypothetical protein